MFKRTAMALLAGVLLISMTSRAHALTVVDIGSGTETSHVVIAFYDNGVFPQYQFNISYNTGDGLTTGIDLISYLDDNLTGFSAYIQSFIFGDFVNGMSYDGFGNPDPIDDTTWLGGELYWHYWIRDDVSDPWDSPMFGASDRTISNGSWDGWIYGSALNPTAVPEPASALLILAGSSLILLRRRGTRQE